MSLHPVPSTARRLPPAGPAGSHAPPAAAVASSSSGTGGVPPASSLAARPIADSAVVGLTYSAPPPSVPQALPSQSLTTHLSDLLLSAVVPGIPKSTPSSAGPQAGSGVGGPRKLSSRKEELNLTSTTGNFRKFVLKVGVVFWVQDRVEEVFTWRKPAWTVCFVLAWALIAFYPHLLLMAPSVLILAVLLNPAETQDMIGIARPTAAAAGGPSTSPERRTSVAGAGGAAEWEGRVAGAGSGSHGRSASVAVAGGGPAAGGGERDGRPSRRDSSYSESPAEKKAAPGLPVASQGATPESLSATYYSNIQGIQNLMGLFSDMHDLVTPPLSAVASPAFPLRNALVAANVLALAALALGGGWVPTWAVLLPLGWGPLVVGAIPISFWSSSAALAPSPALVGPFDKAYRLLLDDQTPASLFSRARAEISVWETQRWGTLEAGGEGWTRSRWEGREVGSSVVTSAAQGTEIGALEGIQPTGGWLWLPNEGWSLDHLGTSWTPSFARLALNGWIFLDESHRVLPYGQDGAKEGGLRRRRWWRRAVHVDE